MAAEYVSPNDRFKTPAEECLHILNKHIEAQGGLPGIAAKNRERQKLIDKAEKLERQARRLRDQAAQI